MYKKFSTTAPCVATNFWEEVYEDQPVPPGLHVQLNTRTGKNFAKLLDDARETNGQKDTQENGKKKFTEHEYQGNVSVNSSLNVKNNVKPAETQLNSSKQTRLELKCQNCKLMFENIQHHLEASLICKQTMHEKVTAAKVNEVVKPMKSKELNAKKMNKSKMMKQKCRGCLKEFSNLNQHIGKSFPCQNNYVDEDYDQTFTEDWESRRETLRRTVEIWKSRKKRLWLIKI